MAILAQQQNVAGNVEYVKALKKDQKLHMEEMALKEPHPNEDFFKTHNNLLVLNLRSYLPTVNTERR